MKWILWRRFCSVQQVIAVYINRNYWQLSRLLWKRRVLEFHHWMLHRAMCLPHLQLNGTEFTKCKKKLDTSSIYEGYLSVQLCNSYVFSDHYPSVSVSAKLVTSVDIVTTLNPGWSGSIPRVGKKFVFLQGVHTGSRTQRTSYKVDNTGDILQLLNIQYRYQKWL